MARLFARLQSDKVQKSKTVTGNDFMRFRAFWGSADKSKSAVRVIVEYRKEWDRPHVQITIPKGVDVGIINANRT